MTRFVSFGSFSVKNFQSNNWLGHFMSYTILLQRLPKLNALAKLSDKLTNLDLGIST